MNLNLNKKSGFTLVELVVVMIILGILAATAVSKLGGSDKGAYIANMKEDAKRLGDMVNIVYLNENKYPDDFTVVSSPDPKKGKMVKFIVDTIPVSVILTLSPKTNLVYSNIVCVSTSVGGYKFELSNPELDKKVSYDSCLDAGIKYE